VIHDLLHVLQKELPGFIFSHTKNSMHVPKFGENVQVSLEILDGMLLIYTA